MIFVLTGDGKGKTTSALGMALRAAGAGRKVFFIQFLKNGFSSEFKALEKISGIETKFFGRSGFFLPKKQKKEALELGIKTFEKVDEEMASAGLDFAKKIIKEKKHSLIILDEINLILFFGLVKKKDILDLLKSVPRNIDFVLTGRKADKEIIKIADLVTECKEIKHYYQKGVKANKGIEY